jgi:hypothetical protein
MVIPFDRRTGSTHAGRLLPGPDQRVVPDNAPRNHGDGPHDAARRSLLAFGRPMHAPGDQDAASAEVISGERARTLDRTIGAHTLNADDAADLVRMDDDGGHQGLSG